MNIHFHLPPELVAAGGAGGSASATGPQGGGLIENPPVDAEGGDGAPIENPAVEDSAAFHAAAGIENPPVEGGPAATDALENPSPDAETGAAESGGPEEIENPPVED